MNIMKYNKDYKNVNKYKIKDKNINLRKNNEKESEIFKKININNVQKKIIQEYDKNLYNNNNNKKKYIIRNIKPIETDTNFRNERTYYNNIKSPNISMINEDYSHEYKICDYSNYNKTITNYRKKIPVIVVSVKRNKKRIKYNNNKKDYIIKIQAAWRGYFLRKIAIGSIKKYIGFIALIKYIQKINDNNKKKLFLSKLRKYNNDNIIYIKNKNNKNNIIYKHKKQFINSNNKEYINTSPNLSNKYDEIKKKIYISKKINNFQKKKYLINKNTNIKIKTKRFIDIINKLYYYRYYPLFLYRIRILQKMKIFYYKLNKLKNVIYIINNKIIKRAFKKYRDYNIILKIKEEVNKNIKKDNQIKNNKLLNKKEKNININNKIKNYSPLKKLMNKKIELDKKNKKSIMIKYFKLWFKYINNNIESHILNKSDFFLTQGKTKKKYIKIKYSHDISFRTESSLKSEEKDKYNINNNKMKKMKIKSIVINSDYIRSMSFNIEPKKNKLWNLFNKINNKKIINKYFISWKKGKN